jgi:hypothetical protein
MRQKNSFKKLEKDTRREMIVMTTLEAVSMIETLKILSSIIQRGE